VRLWRISLYAVVLICALVGIAKGSVGSGVLWGLFAVFALVSELVRARSGRAGSFTLAFLQLAVFSVALIAGSIALIAGAALAPTKEARNPYIGLAVLVVPMAAVVSWATIAGYRRVRAIRVTSHPPRSANEVYTEMVNASREQTPDPQSPRRQKMMRLFFGIATAGWIIGVLGRTFGTQWGACFCGDRRGYWPPPTVGRLACSGLGNSVGLQE
jgi:hypothetical protein